MKIVYYSETGNTKAMAELIKEGLMEGIGSSFTGKKVALFGSYGWGAGEWMEEWENKIRKFGAELIQESLIVNECPEGEDALRCKEFGRTLAK